MTKTTCVIYLAVDDKGGWVISKEDNESKLFEQLGFETGGEYGRRVKLVVKISPAPAEDGDIPTTTVETDVPDGVDEVEVEVDEP